MEIIRGGVVGIPGEAGFTITEMKQGVKNPERVNVFVDGEFSFSLDVAQVVDLKVKVGRKISAEELESLKKASEFGKLYQRALEWVLVRPRSEREVRDYLKRKIREASSGTLPRARLHGARSFLVGPAGPTNSSEASADFSQRIIERLVAKGYVDDRKFAEFWVENRFVKKGVSGRRLEQELMRKGVSREIIERVMAESGRSDEAEILKMIEKKRKKYTRVNEDGEVEYDDEKLIAYLCRQGFEFQLVQNLVRSYGKD